MSLHSDRWAILADHGACRDAPDPAVFFPAPNGGHGPPAAEAAKRICGSCPVKAQCLELALDTGQSWGVWGGTTEKERRHLNRDRKTLRVDAWIANQEDGAA